MFEQGYRRRLDADLTRWQADGTIAPQTALAIRTALGPMPRGVSIATVVAIVGGLLIAAAFLAFIAANWTAISRPLRFAILLAGIAGAYGIGALLAQQGRTHLADTASTVGSVVFGAAIALVGQMYHIAGDFAAGMMLWAIGALAAAALTGSRGALAVALAAGCIWSGMQAIESREVPHVPFIVFWALAAGLAILWASPVAHHLVSIAAVAWWVVTAIGMSERILTGNPELILIAGASVLFGCGLMMQARGPESVRSFGMRLATYAAFTLAFALPLVLADIFGRARPSSAAWTIACGVAGFVLAAVAGVLSRRAGPALAAIAILLALGVASGLARGFFAGPWLTYAWALLAALCLILSGLLDDNRLRLVAGWIGLALVIATITWTLRTGLLTRSIFLAISGAAAIALAVLLGRVAPKEKEAAG